MALMLFTASSLIPGIEATNNNVRFHILDINKTIDADQKGSKGESDTFQGWERGAIFYSSGRHGLSQSGLSPVGDNIAKRVPAEDQMKFIIGFLSVLILLFIGGFYYRTSKKMADIMARLYANGDDEI